MVKKQYNQVNSMIGNYTESLRRSRQLSQHQLADMLLIDRQQIAEIESGTHPLSASDLYRMCKVFETTVDEFYINAFNENTED